MNEQDFIKAVQAGFGANTSVTESFTEAELTADYRAWRGRQAKKSPLKTDNKLARQAYLTELYRAEDAFWQRQPRMSTEDRKTFMRQVLADVTALKARIRAGTVVQATAAVQPVEAAQLPALEQELLALGM